MKRTITLIGLVFLLSIFVYGQETRVYFGLGYFHHTFQDTRFSDLQFSKGTLIPELGFSHSSNENTFFGKFSVFAYQQTHPAYEFTTYLASNINARFGYLRNIKPGLEIGGTWDLLDYTVFEQSDLENSSNTFLISSDFLFTASYTYDLSERWKLKAGGDFGVFSFSKMAPSFTANFEQKVVDNGEVSFQDPNSRNPFALKYAALKPFWKQLYLRTNIEVFYKKRLSLAYMWRVRTIWEQKGYPVTFAQHTLNLKYHFISRNKSN